MDIERQNFMKECDTEVKQLLEKKLLSLPLHSGIPLKELTQEIEIKGNFDFNSEGINEVEK